MSMIPRNRRTDANDPKVVKPITTHSPRRREYVKLTHTATGTHFPLGPTPSKARIVHAAEIDPGTWTPPPPPLPFPFRQIHATARAQRAPPPPRGLAQPSKPSESRRQWRSSTAPASRSSRASSTPRRRRSPSPAPPASPPRPLRHRQVGARRRSRSRRPRRRSRCTRRLSTPPARPEASPAAGSPTWPSRRSTSSSATCRCVVCGGWGGRSSTLLLPGLRIGLSFVRSGGDEYTSRRSTIQFCSLFSCCAKCLLNV
jgi:hypothetical protein